MVLRQRSITVCALGSARHLGKPVQGARQERTIPRYADDRFHARESAPLGSGWKRGEEKQAIGRSRGGRNTKIHALADVKGRLIAILLTGGEAHDCPVAERLIRRVKPSKRMLGDKAYDSAELREDLHERGTKPVIPNRCNREQPFSFSKRIYKLRWRIESASNAILRRWTAWRVRLEVDDHKLSHGTQRRLQLSEIFGPVPDVVIGVHDQSNVDCLREVGGVRASLYRHEVGQTLTLRPLPEVAHHVQLDISGEYFAVGNALGNPHAEISAARADVGDIRSAFQMQCIQSLFGLLPSIAFRVVELLGPLIRIFESTMEGPVGWTTHMMGVRTLVFHRHFGSRLRACSERPRGSRAA